MGAFDAFRYDGKRVLVVGGATGMGAATAELVQDAGAEVVVMDYADVNLPGATLKRVDDSAHFIMFDQPALFAAEVNAFLE